MKLDPKFIEEIRRFEKIYCLISGGYHSTTSALLLKDYGFKNVILIHNKTHLESKSCKNTMKKVIEITGYKYIETQLDLNGETIWDIIKRSFQKIPEARRKLDEWNREKKKFKNMGQLKSIFECCDKLKKKPAKKFYNSINKEKSIVITSLAPYEGTNRRLRMVTLRKKQTYIDCIKSFGNVWHGYPFRDEFHEAKFREYLFSKGFSEIQHTGCVICPILILFNHYDSHDYYNSLKAMARAGLPCFQKTIEDFIKK
ncbi:MAG: hypothetical protein ACFFDN_00405 [Candidatus Hodarchaeota archaeon]